MKPVRKKLIGLAILLVFLVSLGMAVKKVYRQLRQPDLNSALIAAVKKNNTAAVVALLLEGADPNSRDVPPDTRSMWLRLRDRFIWRPIRTISAPTALLVVLGTDEQHYYRQENVPLVKALLNAGAEVNVKDGTYGRPPLIWAAEARKRNTSRVLLERGARINARDDNGDTALHAAALYADPALVDLLLSYDASVNVKNGIGQTPLHNAARHGQPAIIRLLLRHGSDINAGDGMGLPPIFEAVSYNQTECVKELLLHHPQLNTKDFDGNTPLKYAEGIQATQIIQMLLKAGAKE
jgi:ankyrin repeat protein